MRPTSGGPAAVVGGARREAQSTVLSLNAPGATIRLPTSGSSLFYAARHSGGVVSKKTAGAQPPRAPAPAAVVAALQDVDLLAHERSDEECPTLFDDDGDDKRGEEQLIRERKRAASRVCGAGVASLTCNRGPKRTLCAVVASQCTGAAMQCGACVVVGFALGALWRDLAHAGERSRNESLF